MDNNYLLIEKGKNYIVQHIQSAKSELFGIKGELFGNCMENYLVGWEKNLVYDFCHYMLKMKEKAPQEKGVSV